MVKIVHQDEYGTTIEYEEKDQKIAMDLGICLEELMELQKQVGISSKKLVSAFESQTQISPERLAELREQNARLSVQAKMFNMPETAKLHSELQSNLRNLKKKTLLQKFKNLLARAKREPEPWDGDVEVMPWEEKESENSGLHL